MPDQRLVASAERVAKWALADSPPVLSMTAPKQTSARVPLAGLIFLAITAIGWGLTWPVNKFLLGELPPLTLRGGTALVGAIILALLSLLRGQSLVVPRAMWTRVLLVAVFTVGTWMTLTGLSLLYLPASEAVLIAYTFPVWTVILAWPVLGEQPTVLRLIALIMAFAGLAAILGANGVSASMAKLPGMIMALAAAIGFALGSVMVKKRPIHMPPIPAASWQLGIGSLPLMAAGLLIETTHLDHVSALGWWLLAYSTVGQFCIAYVCWFAALARLPASVAAIGVMAAPVIGVATSALTLGEPLGPGQIAALIFTLAGVALATR
jgi:drug/metabolite transporter (DMT)-like permease